MISNISQIKRKAKLEKSLYLIGKFLVYIIPLCILILVGLFSLSAISQSS